MLDAVGREIHVGDIITYAQRKGDTGGLSVARVVALTHPKREGEQLVVKIPTDTFHTVYVLPDGTIQPPKEYGGNARYVGFYVEYKAKQTIFEYPGRATVVPDRSIGWWEETFKIGQIEYRYNTGEYWPNNSAPCDSIEEILEKGV